MKMSLFGCWLLKPVQMPAMVKKLEETVINGVKVTSFLLKSLIFMSLLSIITLPLALLVFFCDDESEA